MTVGVALVLCSLIYSIFLNILFFSKRHIKTLETKLYGVLIVLNLVGLILELCCSFGLIICGNNEILLSFVLKAFLVYLLTFVFLFSIYVFTISYSKDDFDSPEFSRYFSKIKFYSSIVYILYLILIIVLPIYYYNDGIYIYSYGPGANLSFLSGGIFGFACIVCIILNYKTIKLKKCMPLLIFIVGAFAAMIIQKFIPNLTIMTSVETFIMMLMYHTIENPDIKLLVEIANKRAQANRVNNDKAMFLFNMSQDIKKPVMDIQVKCENTLMSETEEEYKDGVRSIKESANQISRLINASLNINEASSANLRLVDKRYSTNLLFREIVESVNVKLVNTKIEFRKNVDDSIPEYLMGDSIRIKQVIAIMLNNAIKHTREGFIELDVSYIMKRDICSLIINVEDSGIGMSQEKLDEVLNNSREVTGDKDDIATAKALAGLSNGTIMGISEEGKGSKFTIIINQKLAPDEVNAVLKSVSKVDSDKKILVVENDEKEQNKIIKLLKSTSIDLDITNMGVGCLEKIRGGAHYDLIIINEELPKLSGIMTYQKLKLINNFNIPVVMIIDKKHLDLMEKYLDLGIKNCIISPVKKENLLEVISKSIKS